MPQDIIIKKKAKIIEKLPQERWRTKNEGMNILIKTRSFVVDSFILFRIICLEPIRNSLGNGQKNKRRRRIKSINL